MTQWLAEQSTTNNPTQSKYITFSITPQTREESATGSYNCIITFSFEDLLTTSELQGDSLLIEATVYLQ